MTNETYKPNALRGVLCTLLGGCCWGFSGNCGQYLFHYHGVDPVWLTAVRMMSAGAIATAIVAVRNRQALKACFTDKHDRIVMLLYGVFGLLLSQYTYLEAIEATNAGTATVLQYVGPVLLMVLVCFTGRRLPKPYELVSIVLVVAGTFLLATHGNVHTMVINPEGLFWGLFAACTLVLYTLLPKSITTAIGMGLSEELGGMVSVTIASIIISGVTGNMLASVVFKVFRIVDPIAQGLACGTASHAIGTAKAREFGDIQEAMSGLSIAVCGILTVVLASVFAGIPMG